LFEIGFIGIDTPDFIQKRDYRFF